MDNKVSKESAPVEDATFDFPQLPAEMQVKILEFAFPGPRVIFFKTTTWYANRTSHAPPIGLLEAFFKSRAEVLKHWKPLFAAWSGHPEYFNPSSDTLLFDAVTEAIMFVHTINPQELSLTRFMAVKTDEPSFSLLLFFLDWLEDAHGSLPNLEEVTLCGTNLPATDIAELEQHPKLFSKRNGTERRISVLIYQMTEGPQGLEDLEAELVARRVVTGRADP